MTKKQLSILAATAVGALFATASFAGDTNGNATTAGVKCIGGNACKGTSECKTTTNACKGQNTCKGTGFVYTESAQDCINKGGQPESQ